MSDPIGDEPGSKRWRLNSAATSGSTRIAYQIEGTGPLLVLLSGQANSHTWWDDVRRDFTDSFTTVTIDYRGTGDSDRPETGYSTPEFAEDVVAVLDALGAGAVHLYGTSMGGRVAQHVAARHPDRVRALVLGCTTSGGAHSLERSNDVRRGLAAPSGAAAFLLDLMYTPGWLATHPGPYTVLGDPTMPIHARRGHLQASNRHDAWDVLPNISAPTLILHGTDDLLAPAENAQLLASRIPQSTVHLFPGARHAYFDEERATASPLVRDFLRAS